MTLMTWLREKLGRGRNDKRYDAAIASADSFIVATRSLRQQIEPYALRNDPFAAMTRAREAADRFNRETGFKC